MNYYLNTGLLIGLIFGIPAGAIGALTIKRSMQHVFLSELSQDYDHR